MRVLYEYLVLKHASYDSVDSDWVLSARTEGGKQDWDLVGGANYQDSSHRTSGTGEKLVPSAYRSIAAGLKFVINTNDRSTRY